MTELEQKVLDLIVKVGLKERWIREQPWHGYPIMPLDRVFARRELRDLEDQRNDAIKELVDSIE